MFVISLSRCSEPRSQHQRQSRPKAQFRFAYTMAENGDDMMETPIMKNANNCQTSTSSRTLGLVAGHDAVEPQPKDQSYVGNKTLEPQSKDQSRIALEIRQRLCSPILKITNMRVMLYRY